MKKLLIATAVAASMATAANAASYNVSSNITGLALYVGTNDLMVAEAPGFINGFAFGGTATDSNNDGIIDSANLTVTGQVGFTANGNVIRLTFDLNNSNYTPGSGPVFTGGNILVDILTTEGYQNYTTVDASTTNLPFLAGQPGHMADTNPGQVTAGLVLLPGIHNLPGLWDGVPESANFNSAISSISLLGQTAGMFVEGTVSLVPVPAAAWMFGSAVLGLAGVSRKRKTA